MGRRGLPRALSVLGLMRAPGGLVRVSYFSFVFLLDVSEEGGVGEVPLATRAAELAFSLILGFDCMLVVGWAFLLTH